MRMKALSASVSAFSRLLASICLRYGVAKPSVWPRKRGCNRRQFSDFRSDSPLNFMSFGFRFGDVGEAFRVYWFLVLQLSALSISVFTFQSTARCSSVYFSWRLPCLVLRWGSSANRLPVGQPLYSRVRDSDMAACAVVGINVALAATSMEHQRVALDLARC
jgi:hypothetical protein